MKAQLLFIPVVLLAACGPRFIEGTKVEDTEENREIVDLVDRYRLAVEKRDIDTLKGMISRHYFANAGTTSESEDDYGYDLLEAKILPRVSDDIKSIQFRIVMRNVSFQGERAFAEFEFWYKFFYVDGGKDRWVSKNNFNRLEFIKEDGVWRIIGGL